VTAIGWRALDRGARCPLAAITEVSLGSSLLRRIRDLRVAAALCRQFL
jgi:hypothetical protein